MDIQKRIIEYCLQRQAEEESMLSALKLEEEKQKRLERSKILKLILGGTLGAKKLRKMIGLMDQLTLEDLEMEMEEVEAKVTELIETEEESR